MIKGVLMLTFGAALAVAAGCTTQNPPRAVAEDAQTHTAATLRSGPDCVRETGSRIAPKKGDCLPGSGRSYTGEQLQSTGYNDVGRALQTLDPSVRVRR